MGGFVKGTVKSFNSRRGYGYILSEDGTEIFVHYTGINMDGFKMLEPGQRVLFNIIEGIRGPQATNVIIE
ncbi:MAG: cold shock domain-containing protein [Eubacteriales bacterium]|nr:cold shock domain-containing protein [Eubacteriales bacterium]